MCRTWKGQRKLQRRRRGKGEIDGRMWLKEVKRLLDEGIQKQYADIEIQVSFCQPGLSLRCSQ